MQAFSTDTDLVPEGLTLAQAVLDAHGQLLLPAGAPLTLGVLRSLQQRDIETVFVQLPEPAAAAGDKAAEPAENKAAMENRLLHLFRPAMRAGQLNPLFHLILNYRAGERLP